MFSIGEGPRSDKGSLRKMKMKYIIGVYLHELSDIGSKSMLQIL